MHYEVNVFDIADLVDLVANAMFTKLCLAENLGGDLIDHFNGFLGGVLNAHDRFSIKESEDRCLDRGCLSSFCAYDQEHALVVLDLREDEEHEEGNQAAHAGNDKVAYAAADTNDDRPEYIYGVAYILNSRAETNDGKRTDHTERERYVITDDGHYSARKYCEYDKGSVEFFAIDGASVGEVVGEIDDGAEDRGENDVHNDRLPGQVLLTFH